jgi:YD repeat-containing protein
VDYDRTLRTEKIYDDHRKFLLKIIYDATGQPVVWVPSSKLLPVNVSRSSSGQITVLQRGPTVERVEYDAQGRLVSRVFADGRTWSYTYLEKVSTAHLEKVSRRIWDQAHCFYRTPGRTTVSSEHLYQYSNLLFCVLPSLQG